MSSTPSTMVQLFAMLAFCLMQWELMHGMEIDWNNGPQIHSSNSETNKQNPTIIWTYSPSGEESSNYFTQYNAATTDQYFSPSVPSNLVSNESEQFPQKKAIVAVYIPYNASRNQNDLSAQYTQGIFSQVLSDNAASSTIQGDKTDSIVSASDIEIIKSVELAVMHDDNHPAAATNPYYLNVIKIPEESTQTLPKETVHFSTEIQNHSRLMKREAVSDEAPISTKEMFRSRESAATKKKISIVSTRKKTESQQATTLSPEKMKPKQGKQISTATLLRQRIKTKKAPKVSRTTIAMRQNTSTSDETGERNDSSGQTAYKPNEKDLKSRIHNRKKQILQKLRKNHVTDKVLSSKSTSTRKDETSNTTTEQELMAEANSVIPRKSYEQGESTTRTRTKKPELVDGLLDYFDLFSRSLLSHKLLRKPSTYTDKARTKYTLHVNNAITRPHKGNYRNLALFLSDDPKTKSDFPATKQRNDFHKKYTKLRNFEAKPLMKKALKIVDSTYDGYTHTLPQHQALSDERYVKNDVSTVDFMERDPLQQSNGEKADNGRTKTSQRLSSSSSHWDFGRHLRPASKKVQSLIGKEAGKGADISFKSQHVSSNKRTPAQRISTRQRTQQQGKVNIHLEDSDEVLVAMSDKVTPTVTVPVTRPDNVSLMPHSSRSTTGLSTSTPSSSQAKKFRPSPLISISYGHLTDMPNRMLRWKPIAISRAENRHGIHTTDEIMHPKVVRKRSPRSIPSEATSALNQQIQQYMLQARQQLHPMGQRRQLLPPQLMNFLQMKTIPMRGLFIRPMGIMQMTRVKHHQMKMVQIRRLGMGMMLIHQRPMKMIHVQHMPVQVMHMKQHPMQMVQFRDMQMEMLRQLYRRRNGIGNLNINPGHINRIPVHQYPRR